MKSRKFLVLLSILFLLPAVIFSGCTQNDEESLVPEEENEAITLHFLGCAYVADGLDPLFEEYEELHPGINIEFQAVPFDNLNDVLTAQLSSGSSTPDVFWADMPRVPALASRGFLLNLDDHLVDLEGKVFETSIVESSWNDILYSFPVSTSTMMLFYNVDLLDNAGIEYPSADVSERWTWEQLVEAAEKAKDAGSPYGLVLDQVDRYYQLQPLVESAGGGSGLTGPDNLTPDISNDGWLKAMNFYHDIHEQEISPRGVAWEQIPDMFNTNQIAFYVSGPWTALYSQGVEGLNYAVAPHPYFEGGEIVTPTGSWALGINPKSEHLDEAIEFAKFISLNPDANLSYNSVEGSPPALKEVFGAFFEQEAFTSNPGLSSMTEISEYDISNTSIPRPRSIGYLQFETIMGAAFSDIRNGLNPEDVLQKAEADLLEVFDQLD